LISCGNSSRLVVRRIRPIRVTRHPAEQPNGIVTDPLVIQDGQQGGLLRLVRSPETTGATVSRITLRAEATLDGEPIRAETLESFAETFAPAGFRKEAFLPAYGMAESTLAISFSPAGKGLVVDRVDAAALREGSATPARPEQTEDVLRIVGCGPAFEAHEVGVFDVDDAESAAPLADRKVGELRLRGPSVTRGYFEDAETTAAAFAGGWLRTGDLGYRAGGDVFVCGRLKEVIIVNGRNFYPQDIEWEASQVDGVRKGNVIAFGSRRGGDKELVILAFETSATDDAEKARMVAAIRTRVQDVVALSLDEVIPLAVGALPKTSSGKLQRTKTRQLWDEGELLARRSAREQDRVAQVTEIAKSQLGYLKVALFGPAKPDKK
jgi:acyl-CoA synthetase (AMP-forming)/AMP-acid ligase II